MKKKIIFSVIAFSLIPAAFFLRLLLPGIAHIWPFIFILPGISFLILGIIWQKIKFVLPVSQILFSICLAMCLAELYFQKVLETTKIQGIMNIGHHEKKIDVNGKIFPVFTLEWLGGYTGTVSKNKPDIVGIDRQYRQFFDGSVKVIIDAVYSTDFMGFRKVSCRTEKAPEPPLLFFGDSFTFGIGVNDDEVYVNRIAEKLKGKRNVYNFAVSGGSPAEFYYFLDQNVIETSGAERNPPGEAYYLIINDHRYRILGSRARNHGPFLTRWQKCEIAFVYWTKMRLFYKSALFDAIGSRFHKDLYIHYLKAAENVLKNKYGIPLTVIVYPDCMPEVIEQLKQAGFRLKYLKEAMPGYQGYHTRRVDLKYEIPYDGHPTAKTHGIIADYICGLINNTSQKTGKQPE